MSLCNVQDRHAEIDDSVLSFDCAHDQKRRVALHILEQTGFDMRKSSFFEVLHPMCTGVGPQDARVTTNYRNLFSGIFSTLHEGGHARYNYSSNQEAQEYSLWGGIGGAMHESQSRFYENMVGKSSGVLGIFLSLCTVRVPGTCASTNGKLLPGCVQSLPRPAPDWGG